MINLLDLEAPSVAAPKCQGNEDAVVDWRARPASRLQGLKILKGDRNQLKAHPSHFLVELLPDEEPITP